MKKECSAEEARVKAEAYCAAAERCKADVSAKLQQWGVSAKAADEILHRLEEERFIDEARYAAAFVRDKYRFERWGRVKISQALRMKRLDAWAIERALEHIDEGDYLDILTSLLEKKRTSVKGDTDYERNGRLIRFAAGRGYEMNDILRCLQRIGCDDTYSE